MIIGFDASRAFVSSKTGTENYSYQLLKALAKIDRVNKYIVYTRPFISNTTVSTMKLPKNFKMVEIPWKRFWTQGGLAFQTFTDNLDVLFVPAHTLPLIRKPNLKTVVTVHDLGSEYLPKTHQLKQRLYLSFMQKHQLKTATRLIAVSEATKRDLMERIALQEKNIKVVYEGYDKELFKPIKGDILVNSLRHYKVVPGQYFLFVGTVQTRKNIERIIKAFKRLLEVRGEKWDIEERHLDNLKNQDIKTSNSDFPSPNLIIAGSKGWLSDDIYKLPKKLGVENQVKFLGYVPEKDLPALYSGAIALVFPSLFEGFGLPIIEAQACGCPVITSNLSSMPEVAGKGALLVDPYNIDDIVKGMFNVQSSKFKVKSSIQEGYENIKRFSWEKCAKQTLKVFGKTLISKS